MQRHIVRYAAALAVLLSPVIPAGAQSKNRELITTDEIMASSQKDADIFAVIRALRPNFLQTPKGVRSLTNGAPRLAIYIDGTRETDMNSLKSLSASLVAEVRYMDPASAENQFGQEANGGAVIVKTRSRSASPAAAPKDTTKPPQT